MKKLKVFISLTILTVMLSSCSFTSFDADSLLSPPQMNADNQEIDKVISDTIGGSYRLVYPKNGSYQTAINSMDITGNGQNEAVCFYSTDNDQYVNFILLEEQDGKWSAIGVSKSQASSVDKVAFSDLNNDGVKEIIIGWQYLTGEEKAIEIFLFDSSNAEIKSVYTGVYSSFIAYDDSVTVISRNTTGKTASATLIGNRSGNIEVLNTVALNNAITGFTSVQTGHVNGTRVIYIDEQLESSLYTTEVLTITQVNGLLLSNNDVSILTTRTHAYKCTDVDGDGNPDLPSEKTLPAYKRGETEESLSYIDWYSFTQKGTEYIKSAYTSLNEQFYFEIPKEWIGNITIERGAKNERSINFYLIEGKNQLFMFSLRVFSQQEFSDTAIRQRYTEITTANENVYAFKESSADIPEQYKVTLESAKESFNLIS